MTKRRLYRAKPDNFVVAVPLRFDTAGFVYKKWGGEQRCKPSDWIVDNDGDFYTVGAVVFARTYCEVSPGVYRKITPVWAEIAQEAEKLRPWQA